MNTKTLWLVLWLMCFGLSSLATLAKEPAFMYTWRCVFCNTIYMTNAKGVPESKKCKDKDSFHTWQLEDIDSLDDPPKQPEPA